MESVSSFRVPQNPEVVKVRAVRLQRLQHILLWDFPARENYILGIAKGLPLVLNSQRELEQAVLLEHESVGSLAARVTL